MIVFIWTGPFTRVDFQDQKAGEQSDRGECFQVWKIARQRLAADGWIQQITISVQDF
jgi:hypothetical protein